MRYILHLVPEKGGIELQRQLAEIRGCVEVRVDDLFIRTTPDLAARLHQPVVAQAIEQRLKTVVDGGLRRAKYAPESPSLPPAA